jgi:carbon-monoxide dehydrogenase medium subunit
LREVVRSGLIREQLPMLAEAAAVVGNPRVRAMATVGGAIVHGDPRQDVPPVLIALGARVRIAGPGGQREVAMSEFFDGFMTTVVGDDELVLDVVVPVDGAARTCYSRFAPASVEDFPLVAVASAVTRDASSGVVTAVRVGVGGATSNAFLLDAAAALVGTVPDAAAVEAVARAAADAADPVTDSRGSAQYKHAMFQVWTQRNLTETLGL